MGNFWSWFVIIGTVVSLAACLWLVIYAKRQRTSAAEIKESESHVWDENVRELNNPLPMWWLWLFIGTVLWSGAYLIYFPGLGGFGGLGEWSQEQQYADEIAAAEVEYGPIFAGYGAMEVGELIRDEDALGIGFSLYQNYCSQCHGSTAQGGPGFPDLTDEAWQWGGQPAQIEHSIVHGRTAVMPALGAVLGSEQAIDEMVAYVQDMQDGMDTRSPAHARYMQVCIACHGADGSGMQALGAPSLVDDNWLYGSSPHVIRRTIVEGRSGVMPAHGDLIGEDRARILAAYVYSLSR